MTNREQQSGSGMERSQDDQRPTHKQLLLRRKFLKLGAAGGAAMAASLYVSPSFRSISAPPAYAAGTPGPTPTPTPPPLCGDCKGGVTSLTLQYNGGTTVSIEVKGGKQTVFSGVVVPGQSFSFNGTGKDGKLGKEIKVYVNGVETKIHTSCSKPIGPGMTFGLFTVIEGYSKDGGLLCPAVGGGDACTTKVQAMLLRYTGLTILGATVEFESDKGQTVVYTLVDLISGVTELSDSGQNGFTIDATVGGEIEFGAKTSIRINGVEEVIHTSCSTPFVAQAPAPLDQPKGDPSPNWFVVSFTQK